MVSSAASSVSSSSTYSMVSLAEDQETGSVVECVIPISSGGPYASYELDSLPAEEDYNELVGDWIRAEAPDYVARLSEEALRECEAKRQRSPQGMPRVSAVLFGSGTRVGWYFADQAEQHRFSFAGNLKVEELLRPSCVFCKEINSDTAGANQWCEPMQNCFVNSVVFANGSKATLKDELWYGPGPIILYMQQHTCQATKKQRPGSV